MRKHSINHIQQSRVTISLLKWFAIASFILLPFSFSEGVANWKYLIVAPLVGVVWVVCTIYYWRTESGILSGVAFLIFIGAHPLSDNVYSEEPPFGHFMQWLSLFLVVAAIPIFRSQWLLRYCGLQELDAAEQSKASDHIPPES